MAFLKLDTGILDSSLWFDRDALDVFLTAICMARPKEFKKPLPQIAVRSLDPTGWVAPPGRYGYVEASGPSIVRRSPIGDLDAGMGALERLGAPDAASRTPDHDGRRLIRVDGGYLVLNFDRYREKDHTAPERNRKYRARKRSETVTAVTSRYGVTGRNVTQAEAEAEAEAERNTRERGSRSRSTSRVLIPADWQPTAKHRQLATDQGLNVTIEAEKFKAHAHANGRELVDWNAGFTRWLLQARDFDRGGRTVHISEPKPSRADRYRDIRPINAADEYCEDEPSVRSGTYKHVNDSSADADDDDDCGTTTTGTATGAPLANYFEPNSQACQLASEWGLDAVALRDKFVRSGQRNTSSDQIQFLHFMKRHVQ